MSSLLNISGLIAAVFLSALGPAVSAPECDFFKVEGGYLESAGDFGGDFKCSPYPSVEAAKEECRLMVGCDGFSFGPWGTGLGGCLKMNRRGGFTANPDYVGYHKTLMGCCGDDKLDKTQCHVQEVRHVDKRVLGGKRVEKLVSRGKPTTQSSLYKDSIVKEGGLSAKAVDGNKNQRWAGKSCSLTLKTLDPWWSVDLLDEYDVSRVEITSRNASPGQSSNLMISVGDNPSSVSSPACLIGGAVGVSTTKSFPCALRGRFVTITSVSNSAYLSLCEVEVYAMVGTKEENKKEINIV
ncbi:hypothetical protein BSKO_05802 [Bryopsis sp. KO-2023]|nr:hypothetical protein BSKO_05802 [Bryopsis sp. KO-2023]